MNKQTEALSFCSDKHYSEIIGLKDKALKESNDIIVSVKSDLIWALSVIMDEYPATDDLFKRACDLMRKHIDKDFKHWADNYEQTN